VKDQASTRAGLADTAVQPWRFEIQSALYTATGIEYSLIRDCRLLGVYLAVFVRSDLVLSVYRVLHATAAVGVMNTVPNKGGVAIRCQVLESSVCFVTSHLAAGAENTLRRNQDYQSILAHIRFEEPGYESILDHEYVDGSSSARSRSIHQLASLV